MAKRRQDRQTIAQLKKDWLEYYTDLPIKQAACDHIGRSLDTVARWEAADPKFADGLLNAKAAFARKHGKRRPDTILPKLYPEMSPEPITVAVTDVRNPDALQTVLAAAGFVPAAGQGDTGTE